MSKLQTAVEKKDYSLSSFWLNFNQDTLEARYQNNALQDNIKPLAWLFPICALLVLLPSIPLLLAIAKHELLYIVLSIALMPIVAGVLQAFTLSKNIKHQKNCNVSMLFVLLLNLSSVILGFVAAWFGFPIPWMPVAATLFCFGLALWLPVFKTVVAVIFFTVIINTFAMIAVGIYHPILNFDFVAWTWFILSLLSFPFLSYYRNLNQRKLYLLESQLKISKNDLDNESFERRRLWQLLKHNVQIDPVTHLFESKYFMKLSQLELERAKRYQRPMSLLIVQIEKQTELVKEYGEEWMQKLEMRIASMFRQQLRQQDIIGRIDKNDFGILLPETGISDAKIVMIRLNSTDIEQETSDDHKRVSINLKIVATLFELNKKADVNVMINEFEDVVQRALKELN